MARWDFPDGTHKHVVSPKTQIKYSIMHMYIETLQYSSYAGCNVIADLQCGIKGVYFQHLLDMKEHFSIWAPSIPFPSFPPSFSTNIPGPNCTFGGNVENTVRQNAKQIICLFPACDHLKGIFQRPRLILALAKWSFHSALAWFSPSEGTDQSKPPLCDQIV